MVIDLFDRLERKVFNLLTSCFTMTSPLNLELHLRELHATVLGTWTSTSLPACT